jgi:hypothetical protein
MRTISIQADGGPGGNNDVMRVALRYIVTNMPCQRQGLQVQRRPAHRDHRQPPTRGRMGGQLPAHRAGPHPPQQLHQPDAVVRAIIERQHNTD